MKIIVNHNEICEGILLYLKEQGLTMDTEMEVTLHSPGRGQTEFNAEVEQVVVGEAEVKEAKITEMYKNHRKQEKKAAEQNLSEPPWNQAGTEPEAEVDATGEFDPNKLGFLLKTHDEEDE
jgi:hypothetical protein